MRSFDVLLDRVLTRAEVGKFQLEDAVFFDTDDGCSFVLYHRQDCCEYVYLAEVIGELSDLVNDGPVLLAEEIREEDSNASESGTWTFYKLRTHGGDVTLRFNGQSNGYYSESVDFFETTGLDD
jgi:hypothetical protein